MLADMNRVLPRLISQVNNSPSYSINNQKESSYQVNNPNVSQTNSQIKNDFAYSTPGNNVRSQFRSPILDQATAKAKENQSGGIFKMFGMA
jgi:hypothetical protein